MSDYKIEKLDSTQFDVLIPLMKDCFGMDANIDYFKWKFMDNPAGHFTGFIARDNKTNEVAAYYGVIPEDYMIDGEKQKIYQSCDTMTHSRHRRKGLFQKLAVGCYDYLRENDQMFVIGFGGEVSTPGLLKFGWKRSFDFYHLFVPKILCYSSLLSKYKTENFQIGTDVINFEHLIEDKNSARIHSFRNAENFVWRHSNPLIKYEVLTFKQDEQIEGYLSYYIRNNKIFIFDFVFSDDLSRKALIQNLKKRTLDENLTAIVAFCQENGSASRELKRSGFLANPFGRGPGSLRTPFMFYASDEKMSEFLPANCWSIKSFDHDSY